LIGSEGRHLHCSNDQDYGKPKVNEAGTSDRELNKQKTEAENKEKLRSLKMIYETSDETTEIPDDLKYLESAFGWNIKRDPLLEMPIHGIGLKIKRNKVIRTLAWNVIAKKEAKSYPLIAKLLIILKSKYPKSVEIVKVGKFVKNPLNK
jgi:hypothetical protein